MTNELKRYEPSTETRYFYEDEYEVSTMAESSTGRYVLYEDMKAFENKIRADAVRGFRNEFPSMLRKMWSAGEVLQALERYADKIERGEV